MILCYNISTLKRKKKAMTNAWELTREAWNDYVQFENHKLVEKYNSEGCKGFPPTLGHNSIYKIIALGERAGYELPREADKLLQTPYHELSVEVAIAEGQSVPPEVLADYPHLMQQRRINRNSFCPDHRDKVEMEPRDRVSQQIEELVKAGIFRDLRCPDCDSRMITTNLKGQHRCLGCGTKFTDNDLERK